MNLLLEFPKVVVWQSTNISHVCVAEGTDRHERMRRRLGHATTDRSYQQGLANRASSIRDRTVQC